MLGVSVILINIKILPSISICGLLSTLLPRNPDSIFFPQDIYKSPRIHPFDFLYFPFSSSYKTQFPGFYYRLFYFKN